jgi:hypothetical protein
MLCWTSWAVVEDKVPSLKQFRNWLAGDPVAGLPDRGLRPDAEEYIEKAKYDVRVDGRDARLKFGRFNTHLLSELHGMSEGLSYLRWLANSDFPDELKRLARAYAFPRSDDAKDLGLIRKRAKRKG